MKFKTAIIASVIIHIGLIALLLTNYQFSKVEVKQTGSNQPKINATAVNSKRVEQLVENLKKQKSDQKRREQKRLDDLKKAEQDAKKRRQEEEKKAADAKKRREQAERKRKDEEKKALALKKKREKEETERKKKAEAEKRRKAEAERKRKAEEERKRKEEERKRKEREEAERKRKEAEEKARQEALEREMQAQMEAEAAELAAARQQAVMSEVDVFNTRIRSKIERNWFKPESFGQCTFRIKMSPGGLVINIEVINGSPAHCESGRRAILRAEPLPVSKDPDVFNILKTRTFKLENENEQE